MFVLAVAVGDDCKSCALCRSTFPAPSCTVTLTGIIRVAVVLLAVAVAVAVELVDVVVVVHDHAAVGAAAAAAAAVAKAAGRNVGTTAAIVFVQPAGGRVAPSMGEAGGRWR